MEMKTVKVLTRDRGFVRVWALVDGNLAITPTYASGGKFCRGLYGITHVPSGCLVNERATALAKDELPRYWEQIKDRLWHGVHIYDMPVCEILTLTPRLMKDRGLNNWEVEEWQRNDMPIIARALDCGRILEPELPGL